MDIGIHKKPSSLVGKGGNLHFLECGANICWAVLVEDAKQQGLKMTLRRGTIEHGKAVPKSCELSVEGLFGMKFFVAGRCVRKGCWFQWSKNVPWRTSNWKHLEDQWIYLANFNQVCEVPWSEGVFGNYFSCLMQQCILPLGRDAGMMACPRARDGVALYVRTSIAHPFECILYIFSIHMIHINPYN